MREKYNELFSTIKPQTEDKALLNAVVAQAQQEKSAVKKHIFKRVAFVPAVALLIVSIAAISVGAVYGGIQYLRTNNMYAQNENVAQSIKTQVYSDENEHVRIVVDEVLSDNQLVYAVVHYEALTDIGRDWLDDVKVNDLSINPKMEEHLNFYCSVEELDNYRADNERYYCLELTTSADVKGSQVEFNYVMPDDSGKSVMVTADVDISGSVARILYKLEGKGSPSEYYTPDCISVSNMTYTIYGFDNGCYEEDENGEMPMSDPKFVDELLSCEIYLVMSDSTMVKLGATGGFTPIEPSSETNNTDFIIVGGSISDTSIEPENVIGLELGGIYYELTPIS